MTLRPGETLVIFSDGVTEAASDDGEQFGEGRLIETLLAHRHESASQLLDGLLATIEQFSGRVREDDVTLVIARAQ